MKSLPAPHPSSILSFRHRGPWGDACYPGNSSGFVLLELLAALKPSFVIDVTAGSGTNIELCHDFGIRVLGLDLKDGFNALKDSVLERAGEPADLTWSHPPYFDLKTYSSHRDDLSTAESEEAFLDKLQVLLLNQREATRAGGHYVTLIGDRRKGGCYSSYQADCITRMPRDELKSVIIKAQHNVFSASKSYALRYPLVAHEYLLVWQRAEGASSASGGRSCSRHTERSKERGRCSSTTSSFSSETPRASRTSTRRSQRALRRR